MTTLAIAETVEEVPRAALTGPEQRGNLMVNPGFVVHAAGAFHWVWAEA